MSLIIRETSPRSRWEEIQRPIARQYAERERQREKKSLNLRLPSNPSHQRSGTQKSHERGGGKIVSIREDGENQDSTGL